LKWRSVFARELDGRTDCNIDLLGNRLCGVSKNKVVDFEKTNSFTAVYGLVDGVVMSGGNGS
jgi:hypothetical protein